MPRPTPLLLVRRLPTCAALTAAAILTCWLVAPEGRSQAPASTVNVAALNALLAKLKTQQDQITANQTKVEAQTALLNEELRQAKIYSARGGGHR